MVRYTLLFCRLLTSFSQPNNNHNKKVITKLLFFDIFNLFLSSVKSPPSKKQKHTEAEEKLQKKAAEALERVFVLSVAEKHYNSWRSQESVDEKQIGSYSSKTKKGNANKTNIF